MNEERKREITKERKSERTQTKTRKNDSLREKRENDTTK